MQTRHGQEGDQLLDYDLSQRGELSLYECLYQHIRNDIVAGRIAAGARLPSKRSLAQHLGVSLSTVEAAYSQLIAEGYVNARQRSGYFACSLPGLPAQTSRPAYAPATVATGVKAESANVLADLTGASETGDPSATRLWSRALRSTLSSEPEQEVYSRPGAAGCERLRRAIAMHLRQTRGMDVSHSNIVIGAGAQLLDGLLVQLLGRSLPFALEDPGYPRLTSLYRANDVCVHYVSLDEQGVRLDELIECEASVLHLMPSHQFPTGCVTSISRRYELLSWASAAPSRYLIEDDYDCEFRLAGRPVPALASIDACGRVIYTNTFSKSLGSALRLAYMVLPDELMARFNRELGFYDSSVSSVEQITLAHLLESGDYERHVNRMRTSYREKRDALVNALLATAIAERLRVEEADSGLHFVLAAESACSEQEIAEAARKEGVLLSPLSDYAQLPQNRETDDGLRRFVVRYGSLDLADAPQTAAVIARALG